jgi:hypothetical protein
MAIQFSPAQLRYLTEHGLSPEGPLPFGVQQEGGQISYGGGGGGGGGDPRAGIVQALMAQQAPPRPQAPQAMFPPPQMGGGGGGRGGLTPAQLAYITSHGLDPNGPLPFRVLGDGGAFSGGGTPQQQPSSLQDTGGMPPRQQSGIPEWFSGGRGDWNRYLQRIGFDDSFDGGGVGGPGGIGSPGSPGSPSSGPNTTGGRDQSERDTSVPPVAPESNAPVVPGSTTQSLIETGPPPGYPGSPQPDLSGLFGQPPAMGSPQYGAPVPQGYFENLTPGKGDLLSAYNQAGPQEQFGFGPEYGFGPEGPFGGDFSGYDECGAAAAASADADAAAAAAADEADAAAGGDDW